MPIDTVQQYLVALDAVLLDLIKPALEFTLTLQALLSPAYVNDFPIDLLSIHFINCLRKYEDKEDLELH